MSIPVVTPIIHGLGAIGNAPAQFLVGHVAGIDQQTHLSKLLSDAGVTGDDNKTLVAISFAEDATHNPSAVNHNRNGTQDTGLWQINDVWKPASETLTAFRTRMKNPAQNAAQAAIVLKQQGLSAWSTYNNGAYRKYLGEDALVTTDKNDSAVTTAGKVAADAASPLVAIGHLAGALLNPSTYLRLGKGLLGGVLVVMGVGGLVYVVGSHINPQVTSAVTKVAKVVK